MTSCDVTFSDVTLVSRASRCASPKGIQGRAGGSRGGKAGCVGIIRGEGNKPLQCRMGDTLRYDKHGVVNIIPYMAMGHRGDDKYRY